MSIIGSMRAALSEIIWPSPAAVPSTESTADLGVNTRCRQRFQGPGKPLLVVFGPGELDVNRPVYRSLLAPIDCNYVIFQSRSTDFFITDWSVIVAHIRELSVQWNPRRTVSWGFSMGGYASLRLGLNENPEIACSVSVTPHFRLGASVSRAQRLKQLPKNAECPDLVDGINQSTLQTRFRIYLPTHSIGDTIHVLDAQQVRSARAEIHYLNVDHGIELKWKEDGLLRPAFESLTSDGTWRHPEISTASTADIATAISAVDYLYQSHGETRTLRKLRDEGVMEAEWHLRKAIAYLAQRDWDGFRESASRSLKLGAAKRGFPKIFQDAFLDAGTPLALSATLLSWTLRYDLGATRKFLDTHRGMEIIRDHVEFSDLCYLLPFASDETAACAAQQIVLRCSDAQSADLGVFAIAAMSPNMDSAVERIAHRAAANNVHAAADAFFEKLASMRRPTTSDFEAWKRTRAAIGLSPPVSN